ncbi:hypothetical protein BGW36DRAFT_376153 [Talaromyces proteolyticus]|uniref:Uncharacterized protein n=1 Tax=Talaromyces proteolyticus TaxID=1131652 RepID=A0AAD4KWH2_9EURO|nr:uncharacterized protein BGW36DRAFT_376153 [Talaromyces proteolyticus]KAH8698467.1 hypothetical protein BGW36DRAFT_376153 [Talaromyces proteolyticus]
MSNLKYRSDVARELAIQRNILPTTRSYHTELYTSQWKIASMAAASKVIPELEKAGAGDTNLLLVLLCFLGNSILPLDLLSRGTAPRKRWNDHGGIEDMDVLHYGVSYELFRICSSPTKLGSILSRLQSFSAISKVSEQTFKLDNSLPAAVIGTIPIEFHPFWRLQALTIACHSIPWKYLEPPYRILLTRPINVEKLTVTRPFNMELFLLHIRYTLQEAQNHKVFENMSPAVKTDIALSIIEASRFPGMEWKQFAISQSKEILSSVQDNYVQSCIAQRESVLHRITSSTDQLFRPLENSQHETVPGHVSKKLHSGSGHGAIQRALDHIQVEELTNAAEVLAAWEPISPPSSMEIVVLFRKHIIMGKIERYRGNFKESLAHLMISINLVNDYKDIVFLEDSSDLVCSLADIYLELEDPVAAERCLRNEIAQRRTGSVTLLRLTLAESLFAQDRQFDAQVICNEIKSLPKLLRMEKLRLSIILAKLAHINAKYNEALGYWTEALTSISRYNLTTGQSTRIILLSMCDVLRQARNLDTGIESQNQLRTQEQLRSIEDLTGPTGVFYWIGGLRHWLRYLESINNCSHV